MRQTTESKIQFISAKHPLLEYFCKTFSQTSKTKPNIYEEPTQHDPEEGNGTLEQTLASPSAPEKPSVLGSTLQYPCGTPPLLLLSTHQLLPSKPASFELGSTENLLKISGNLFVEKGIESATFRGKNVA